MSITSRALPTRGASVLAALVLAAIMASVAMLVQEGSPVASISRGELTAVSADGFSQAQGSGNASGGSCTTCGTSQDKSLSDKCDYRYDYSYAMNDKFQLQEKKTEYCAAHSSECVNENGSLVPKDKNRKSDVRATTPNGDTIAFECNPNDPLKVPIQERVVSTSYQAYENGNLSASDLAKTVNEMPDVGLDASNQKALSDALSKEVKESESVMSNLAQQAESNANELQRLGCYSGYQSMDMGLDAYCRTLQTQQEDIQQKWQEAVKQNADLTSAKQAIDASSGPPAAPDDTKAPGSTCDQSCQLQKENAALKQALQQRQPQTGFGDQAAARAAQQAAQQQAAQRAAQQQAAQQAAQQQQCQPRYQCNTSGTASVVMYNQCPQQNAPWQTYQQCPQGYGCQNNGCVATAQYGYCADGRTPRTGPAQQQPAASSCTVGSWVDQSNGCQTSWQCVAGNATSTSGTNPTAQISCQPQTTISGATTTIAYACANGATKATGTNFSISPSTQLSGSTSTVTTKPSDGSTSVTYTLTCANENVSPVLTASAQCSVRVGNPAIVLVATPDKLSKTATLDTQRKSTIGWVTTGMQSCVVSNADFADWTTQQANITSISGAVTSPVIPSSMSETIFKLTCQTLAGTTASSSVKVLMQ